MGSGTASPSLFAPPGTYANTQGNAVSAPTAVGGIANASALGTGPAAPPTPAAPTTTNVPSPSSILSARQGRSGITGVRNPLFFGLPQ